VITKYSVSVILIYKINQAAKATYILWKLLWYHVLAVPVKCSVG